MEQESLMHAVVVAPAFNNAGTLMNIIERIEAQGVSVIVVNDGSTDATRGLLGRWERQRHSQPVWVLHHPANRGKAAALQTGFAKAAEAGFTHAVTIDTDGQLDPEQIGSMLSQAAQLPQALVIGVRDDTAPDYPSRSRLGRRISNLMVWMESGVRVQDSQCGFRVYPLGLVQAVRCGAGYYCYETEIITRAGWAGCEVAHVPVRCRYLAAGERVSHFRPFMDSMRWLVMQARLLGRTLVPWPRHPRWPQQRAQIRHRAPAWREFLEWISPRRAWREMTDDPAARTGFAAGLAVGVFIANIPAYGAQTLLSLYAARRLHLNPLPVVLGSHLSTPPIGPLMSIAAVGLGHLMFHGTLPSSADLQMTRIGWKGVIAVLGQWIAGGLVMGVVMAAGTFLLAGWFVGRIGQEPSVRLEADQVA
jgi:uncharacterized protein (DUF2062 family)